VSANTPTPRRSTPNRHITIRDRRMIETYPERQ
jgi:hypothetical protein